MLPGGGGDYGGGGGGADRVSIELLSIAIVAVGGNIVTAIHTERVLSIGKSIQFCGAADSLTIAAVCSVGPLRAHKNVI